MTPGGNKTSMDSNYTGMTSGKKSDLASVNLLKRIWLKLGRVYTAS